MSETKHTPGPWVARFADDKRGADTIETAEPVAPGATMPVIIAKLTNRVRGSIGDYRANARLLAAAPDLLEAAEKILADLNERITYAANFGEPVPVFGGIDDLYRAIAKARGTTS